MQKSSNLVHSSSNLIHQIALLLTRSQNQYQQGNVRRALELALDAENFLESMNPQQVAHLEGIKTKCYPELQMDDKHKESLLKLQSLTRRTGYAIGKRMMERPKTSAAWVHGDDILGDLADDLCRDDLTIVDKMNRIFELGVLSWLYKILPVDRSDRQIFFKLKDMSLTVFDCGEIYHQESGMSSQGYQFFSALSQGPQTKG